MDAGLPARLLAVLRDVTGRPGLDYTSPPEPMSGGFWAELFSFSLADPPAGWPRQLVARIMPDPGPARKETIVQSAVAAAGFPTPAVRASGGTGAGLGKPFMVMDWASGAPLLPGLAGLGAVTSALRLFREIPEVLASAMARLHALDPEPIRASLRQGHDVPVTVDGLLAALSSAAARYERDDLAATARWLTAHPPAPAPEVICHGDLHPFNVLVHGGEVTVLDWTAALLAPRAHDVAFTSLLLSEPPLLVPGGLRPFVRAAAGALARRFVHRYQRLAGVTIPGDQLRWNQGVVALRALVEVAGWSHDGTIHTRAGHPWLVSGPAIARRLTVLTGIDL